MRIRFNEIDGFIRIYGGNRYLVLFGLEIDDAIHYMIRCKMWYHIGAKIEDLKNTELNDLPVYYDRYIKTKIRTYGDKVYTKFRGLNMPEDDIECESFAIISIDSLIIYENKYYLQVYLENCGY